GVLLQPSYRGCEKRIVGTTVAIGHSPRAPEGRLSGGRGVRCVLSPEVGGLLASARGPPDFLGFATLQERGASQCHCGSVATFLTEFCANASPWFLAGRTLADPDVCVSLLRHQLHGVGPARGLGQLDRSALWPGRGPKGLHGSSSNPWRGTAPAGAWSVNRSLRCPANRITGSDADPHTPSLGMAVG